MPNIGQYFRQRMNIALATQAALPMIQSIKIPEARLHLAATRWLFPAFHPAYTKSLDFLFYTCMLFIFKLLTNDYV